MSQSLTRLPYRVAALLLAPCLFASTADPLLPHFTTAWEVAAARTEATYGSLANSATWPTIGNGPVWSTTTRNSDWRVGFWPGILWMLANQTGDPVWKARALASTNSLANTSVGDHDVGFIRLGSAGKALQSLDDASDPDGTLRSAARTGLLHGANVLNNLFNHGGVPVGMTRSWFGFEKPYPVCIDNLMNLELLMVAWGLEGNLAYYQNALAHARTSIDRHLRPDGGSYHVVRHFESGPQAGEIERRSTRQGFADETTWSRGQAWAIYGLTAVYVHAMRGPDADPSDILAAAEAVADYFLAHLPAVYSEDNYNYRPGDFVPPSDFQASLGEPLGPWNDADNDGIPGETNSGTLSNGRAYINDRILAVESFTARDSSAAAIAAAGLIQLSDHATTPQKAAGYLQAARDILNCLITYDGDDANQDPDYLSPANGSTDPGILRLASQWYGDATRSLIYGDYYFLEALMRYEALAARTLLDQTLQLRRNTGQPLQLQFDRPDPQPALQWVLQEAPTLEGPWADVSRRVGAGAWQGLLTPIETENGNGTATVTFTLEDDNLPRFYRVVTRSAAEW